MKHISRLVFPMMIIFIVIDIYGLKEGIKSLGLVILLLSFYIAINKNKIKSKITSYSAYKLVNNMYYLRKQKSLSDFETELVNSLPIKYKKIISINNTNADKMMHIKKIFDYLPLQIADYAKTYQELDENYFVRLYLFNKIYFDLQNYKNYMSLFKSYSSNITFVLTFILFLKFLFNDFFNTIFNNYSYKLVLTLALVFFCLILILIINSFIKRNKDNENIIRQALSLFFLFIINDNPYNALENSINAIDSDNSQLQLILKMYRENDFKSMTTLINGFDSPGIEEAILIIEEISKKNENKKIDNQKVNQVLLSMQESKKVSLVTNNIIDTLILLSFSALLLIFFYYYLLLW